MKKLLYTLAAVLVCTGAAAQNPTLYFMEGVPLRSQMNPALAPQRGYFNIPVLGGLAATRAATRRSTTCSSAATAGW